MHAVVNGRVCMIGSEGLFSFFDFLCFVFTIEKKADVVNSCK